MQSAFDAITGERWRRVCDHVDRTIESSKKHDSYRDRRGEKFIIHVGDDTSDDADTSDTETASMGSTTDTASETEWI